MIYKFVISLITNFRNMVHHYYITRKSDIIAVYMFAFILCIQVSTEVSYTKLFLFVSIYYISVTMLTSLLWTSDVW